MTLKYNSGINIMGSIPDYTSMIEYIIEEHTGISGNGSFQFRTAKSQKRFIAGIDESILSFIDEKHKLLFFEALTSKNYSSTEKLMLIFWQMIYANVLFRDITSEVFMKAVYQGRSSLSQEDVYSYVRHLKETYSEELNWSEMTLEIIGSKYLTIMKKLGLAEGNQRKEILYPLISDQLFVYFVRWSLIINPSDRTIRNPFLKFGFFEVPTLITKLKKITFISYWDITQIGDDVTIELKPYE